MAKELYQSLAKYHDLLTQRDYAKESTMLMDIFNKYGRNIHTVLDLACGTGMHMKYLTDSGYETVGIDMSEDMLNVANKNAPKAKLVVGDVRSLDFPTKYDAAIFMGTTFNYLLEDEDFINFETSLHKILNDLLILDTTNFSNQKNLEEVHNVGQLFEDATARFESSRTVLFKNGLRHVFYHHKVTYKDSEQPVEYDDEAIGRTYTLDDLARLTKGKYEYIAAFGDYSTNIPYSPTNSRRLIAVFRKI